MVDTITNYYKKIKAKRITFLALASILVISVVSTIGFGPQVMALVEPHITINMEPDQSTKPLQIKDDLGTEVFSISPDGNVFPHHMIYQSPPDQEIVLDPNVHDLSCVPTCEDTILVLARWDFVKTQGSSLPGNQGGYTGMVIGGEGFCDQDEEGFWAVEWFTILTDDPTSINEYAGAFGSNSVYTARTDTFVADAWEFNDELTGVVVGAYMNDNSLGFDCTVRNITANVGLVLPSGWTITRVI